MEDVIFYFWKRNYLQHIYFNTLPNIKIILPSSKFTVECILNSKYRFIMDRQIELFKKYNVDNKYINELYRLLKFNSSIIKKNITKFYKRYIRIGGITVQPPYTDKNGGLFMLYKITIKKDIINNLTLTPNFSDMLQYFEYDLEKEYDGYINGMYENVHQNI